MRSLFVLSSVILLSACGSSQKKNSNIQSVQQATPPPISSYISIPFPDPITAKSKEEFTNIEWSCNSRCRWYEPDCLVYVGYCSTFRKFGGQLTDKIALAIARDPLIADKGNQ